MLRMSARVGCRGVPAGPGRLGTRRSPRAGKSLQTFSFGALVNAPKMCRHHRITSELRLGMVMTIIVNTKPPAPLWLRELAAARTAYEERLGWPVAMEVSKRRLVVRVGTSIDAIVMPSSTGASVLGQLRMMMLSGPVLATPDGRWTFLTQACLRERPELPVALGVAQVRNLRRGSAVMLPTDLASGDWISEPRYSLPPWSTVVGTARKVLG